MRLLEFPCGRRASLPEETTPTPTAEAGDTQPAAETAPPEKLLRRATRGWVPPWRPSLLSISEDGASVGTPRQPATVAKSGGSVKAKAKAKPAVRAVPRATKYDYQYVNELRRRARICSDGLPILSIMAVSEYEEMFRKQNRMHACNFMLVLSMMIDVGDSIFFLSFLLSF
ncbi:unnamed protein product [Musa acuminata subsp. malaccensis]|uniref:(wild Malaysian banana) hypothetical protein n=1 Tax=Musa acuminata subsp. malaccensis TaxID=214687 RepID=A0A804JKC8_MUSAM|nr:PREDICTED: uncharacterized protein LOC103988956 isoform X1 [Musa acuminata subsp. malaccensis]CAG1847397.1 unnamed protein product [Musa acuminata subsp. malaccensis]